MSLFTHPKMMINYFLFKLAKAAAYYIYAKPKNFLLTIVLMSYVSIISAQTIPDSCFKTFLKTYGVEGGLLEMKDACRTSDGGYVMVGWKLPAPYVSIVKLSKTGAVEWSKELDDRFPSAKALLADDGNFIVITNDYKTQLTKFTNAGNILWSKEIYNGSGYDLTVYDIKKTNDGGFVIVFNAAYGLGPVYNYIVRLDANANIIWKKEIINGATPVLKSVVVDNKSIFIAADFYANVFYPYMEIARLSLETGEFVWKKRFTSEKPQLFNPQLTLINDTLVVGVISIEYKDVFEEIDNFSVLNLAVITGKPLSAFDFKEPKISSNVTYYAVYSKAPSHFTTTNDNNLIFSQQVHSNGDTALNITKFTTGGKIIWSKNYPNYKNHDVWSLKSDGDEILICGRRYVSRPNNTDVSFLLKVDRFGNASPTNFSPDADCYSENAKAAILPAIYKDTVPDFLDIKDYPLINIHNFKSVVSNFNVIASPSCFVLDTSCALQSVTGPVAVCEASSLVTYSAKKSSRCTNIVHWVFDTAYAKAETITDSTITVRFFKPGNTVIQARVDNSCSNSFINTTIKISRGAVSLDLGEDQQVCFPANITLNAKTGFSSYRWNNSSSDSLLSVSVPGLYYVDVEDSCGKSSRDSIVIMQTLSGIVNAGDDRTLCKGDTAQLTAQPGFLKYNWSNNYNISSTNTESTIVSPLVDTAYFLKAEKSPGCFAYDTVRITVNQSAVVDLGADISFCAGDSAVLTAAAGFSQYVWSTGITSPTIVVYAADDYSIKAASENGCKAYDTLKVNVWQKPVVNLGADQGICTGSTLILQAGTYATYAWQDGSTAPTYTINQTGKYYVSVTDANQCSGSDTLIVTGIFPQPFNFLPADTAICNNETIVVNPTSVYAQYVWSDNSTYPNLFVSKPGTYWLQVTDANNCIGKDSITLVPKDCLTGLYIPNVFTPNGDGLNDDFKPIAGSTIKKGTFTIYNQWGEQVYQSTNPGKGWDGKFKGSPQSSNVYAWTYTYELIDGSTGNKKGTVVLIR